MPRETVPASYEHGYYPDLETGELLAISDSVHTVDADELMEQIDGDPDASNANFAGHEIAGDRSASLPGTL